MKKEDKNRLQDILVKMAVVAQVASGPAGYFTYRVKQAELPAKWISSRLTWSGDPSADALDLINWALAKGKNPEVDGRVDTLGSILQVILDDVGLEDQRTVVAIITAYGLYHDQELLDSLAIRYQVPVPATHDATATQTGPNFVWRGPADDVE